MDKLKKCSWYIHNYICHVILFIFMSNLVLYFEKNKIKFWNKKMTPPPLMINKKYRHDQPFTLLFWFNSFIISCLELQRDMCPPPPKMDKKRRMSLYLNLVLPSQGTKKKDYPAKYGIKMLLNWLEIQKWTIWPESADQAGFYMF